MVCCETGDDDCPNGGWLHPECTKDLKDLSHEEIDAIEVWYCEDCQEKMSKKKRGPQREPKKLSSQDKKKA